jgi:hypothetical protein
MSNLPQSSVAAPLQQYPELEQDLVRLKELANQVTPADVMRSIEFVIAAAPASGESCTVSFSCRGSTDAGAE